MVISIIAAVSNNFVIGVNNKMLPWHMPADLKHFKEITYNKTIIMGRKTFESIGKPLKNRFNYIVSRDINYKTDGCFIFDSLNNAICSSKTEEVIIAGGGEIYKQAINFASKIYLTIIDVEINGDVFFPKINFNEWKQEEKIYHTKDKKNMYNYTFLTLKRDLSSIRSADK